MIRADAFAKLTLSLRITGTRDDGYHELDALVVSVNAPYDGLVIEPAEAISLTVTGPYSRGVPVDVRNLAWRAADALGATVSIRLHKGIPHGAGLGGGSADAAAVLAGLEAMGSAGSRDLGEVAASLGSDVPFCLRGGSARMRGIGEIIEPEPLPPLAVVIVTPPFGCDTPAVYGAWDELGGPAGRAVDTGIAALPALVNDLEPAAHHLEPRLVTLRDAIEGAIGVEPILAGSGSSYALLFEHHAPAERARARLAGTIEASVFAGSTADAGVALQP
jgi:4-diphosphocytidyl-2-C-methyl-D-erythritol kinase